MAFLLLFYKASQLHDRRSHAPKITGFNESIESGVADYQVHPNAGIFNGDCGVRFH